MRRTVPNGQRNLLQPRPLNYFRSSFWLCAASLLPVVTRAAFVTSAERLEERQDGGRCASLLALDTSIFRDVFDDQDEFSASRDGSGSPTDERVERRFRGRRKPRPSLTAISSERKNQGPRPADWFGARGEAESSYSTDAFNRRPARYDPSLDDSLPQNMLPDSSRPKSMPAYWFQESRSGGNHRAWQTQYPGVSGPTNAKQPPWHSLSGDLHQSYAVYEPDENLVSAFTEGEHKPAQWFDSMVNQYDGFGRERLPSERSARRYVDWQKRSVNATMKCAEPGCSANTTMQVFDNVNEQHRQCSLSVLLYPTDFEGEYSNESLEWVSVNGASLSARCEPMASGCDMVEQKLQPCISDYQINHLIDESGKVTIASKLSPSVDECPVDGNLLNGVVVVSCLVRQRAEYVSQERFKPIEAPNKTLKTSKERMQCSEPGCTATTRLYVEPKALQHHTCQLTIKIFQTDFDGDAGSNEEVEWVKLDGVVVKSHAKPGINPCKEARKQRQQAAEANTTGNATDNSTGGVSNISESTSAQGSSDKGSDAAAKGNGTNSSKSNGSAFISTQKNSSNANASAKESGTPTGNATAEAQLEGDYLLFQQDVTNALTQGYIEISVKISSMVDECGHEGYLLDAVASVDCAWSEELAAEGNNTFSAASGGGEEKQGSNESAKGADAAPTVSGEHGTQPSNATTAVRSNQTARAPVTNHSGKSPDAQSADVETKAGETNKAASADAQAKAGETSSARSAEADAKAGEGSNAESATAGATATPDAGAKAGDSNSAEGKDAGTKAGESNSASSADVGGAENADAGSQAGESSGAESADVGSQAGESNNAESADAGANAGGSNSAAGVDASTKAGESNGANSADVGGAENADAGSQAGESNTAESADAGTTAGDSNSAEGVDSGTKAGESNSANSADVGGAENAVAGSQAGESSVAKSADVRTKDDASSAQR